MDNGIHPKIPATLRSTILLLETFLINMRYPNGTNNLLTFSSLTEKAVRNGQERNGVALCLVWE
jgi:hypothetical protein